MINTTGEIERGANGIAHQFNTTQNNADKALTNYNIADTTVEFIDEDDLQTKLTLSSPDISFSDNDVVWHVLSTHFDSLPKKSYKVKVFYRNNSVSPAVLENGFGTIYIKNC